nr:unnamed protein product [Digitaria exilis]
MKKEESRQINHRVIEAQIGSKHESEKKKRGSNSSPWWRRRVRGGNGEFEEATASSKSTSRPHHREQLTPSVSRRCRTSYASHLPTALPGKAELDVVVSPARRCNRESMRASRARAAWCRLAAGAGKLPGAAVGGCMRRRRLATRETESERKRKRCSGKR